MQRRPPLKQNPRKKLLFAFFPLGFGFEFGSGIGVWVWGSVDRSFRNLFGLVLEFSVTGRAGPLGLNVNCKNFSGVTRNKLHDFQRKLCECITPPQWGSRGSAYDCLIWSGLVHFSLATWFLIIAFMLCRQICGNWIFSRSGFGPDYY